MPVSGLCSFEVLSNRLLPRRGTEGFRLSSAFCYGARALCVQNRYDMRRQSSGCGSSGGQVWFRRFLWLQLAMSAASALTSPFWVVFLAGAGLTFAQIGILVSASYAATLLFEIPTGVIADLYGRKLSVLIGILVSALTCIGIFAWFRSFAALCLMFVLQGIGATFMTGAFGAWMTDSLLPSIQEEDLPEYWGRLASRGRVGAIAGFAIGGALAAGGITRGLWLVSGAVGLAAFFFSLLAIPETHPNPGHSGDEAGSWRSYWRTLRIGTFSVFRRSDLRWLSLSSFVWFAGTGILSLAWQPLLQSQSTPVALFGPILMIYNGLGAFASRQAGRIVKKFGGEARSLGIAGLAAAVLSGLMLPFRSLSGMPFLAFGALESVHGPIFSAYLNRLISSSERATIISTYSMVTSVSTLLAMGVFGVLADSSGLAVAVLCAAGIMATASGLFLLIGFRVPKP